MFRFMGFGVFAMQLLACQLVNPTPLFGQTMIPGSLPSGTQWTIIQGSMAINPATDLPHNTQWTIQLGTALEDLGTAVAVDALGNSYLGGTTSGNLLAATLGPRDGFLVKFDPLGNAIWTRQFGTETNDEVRSVAVDVLGNAYVTGSTSGSLGDTALGQGDAYIRKYDSDGNVLWSKLFGTEDTDHSNSIAVDSAGNAYITGLTFGNLEGGSPDSDDAFLAKFDALGNLEWAQQFGTGAGEAGYSVAVDGAGNPYVTGYTEANLFRPIESHLEVFLVKFDPDGNQLWGEQTAGYRPTLGVDEAGNAYLSGSVDDSTADSEDIVVTKYDSDGNEIWSRAIGTTRDDWGNSVAIDSKGDVFIAALARGDLDGESPATSEAVLLKYDPAGNLLLVDQFGTSGNDWTFSVATGPGRSVFLAGRTQGSFVGTNAGNYDAFFIKVKTVPESSTGWLVVIAIGSLFSLRSLRASVLNP